MSAFTAQEAYESIANATATPTITSGSGKNSNRQTAGVGRYGTHNDGLPAVMNIANGWLGIWLRRTASAPSGAIRLQFDAGGGSFTTRQSITINGSNQLGFGGFTTFTTVLTQDTWYWVELRWGTGTSAPWSLELFDEDGVSLESDSGNDNQDTNNTDVVQLDATNIEFAGFYIDSAAFLTGAASARPVLFDEFLIDTGGTQVGTAWTGTQSDVDDRPHDDGTTVISSSTTNDVESVALIDAPNITASDTVHAVKCHAFCERDTNPDASMRLYFRLTGGTTTNGATVIPEKDNYDAINASLALCMESAPGQSDWSNLDWINDDSQIGVEYMQAQSRQVNCTQIVGTIAYTPAAAADEKVPYKIRRVVPKQVPLRGMYP